MVFRSLLWVFLFMVAGVSVQADEFYTVSGIKIDEQNVDLVAAKQSGVAKAKREALDTLFVRMTSRTMQEFQPSVNEIENMIVQSQISDETYGGSRYLATLDVEFNPLLVQRFLRQKGISFIEGKASVVRVIPVTRLMGVDIAPKEANPGWDIWQALIESDNEAFQFTPIVLADQELYQALPKHHVLKIADVQQAASNNNAFAGNYMQRIEFFAPIDSLVDQEQVAVRLVLQSLDDESIRTSRRMVIERDSEGNLDWRPIRLWAQEIIDKHWRGIMLAQVGDVQRITKVPMIIYSSDHAEIIDLLHRLSMVRALQKIQHQTITPRHRTFEITYRGSDENFTRQLAQAGLSVREAPVIEADQGVKRMLLEKK